MLCRVRKRYVAARSSRQRDTDCIFQADLRAAEQSERHRTTFQILSDVHLDNFKILTALRALLAVYEEVDDNDKPALFVLCGNFRSRPFLFDGNAEREYKGKLLVEIFSTI